MRHNQRYLLGFMAVVIMLIIILDCKTALNGAVMGIQLCIKTVIPALFPFFFLTGIITSTLTEPLGKILRPLGKAYHIPIGAESALILGLLGGYPIGAQAVANIFNCGLLSKKQAQRMLTYCNNPGPAFIFGMIGCLFESPIVPWALWGIVITGSFITALIQPEERCVIQKYVIQNNKKSIDTSITAMAKVCGWVVLFRVLITILNRWFFWMFPKQVTILLTGFFELTNGCTSIYTCTDVVFQFCSAAAMLCFGGLCVTFQTMGTAGKLIGKKYVLGKLFQTTLSLPLAYTISMFIFSQTPNPRWIIASIISLIFAICIGILLHKNSTGNIHKNVI